MHFSVTEGNAGVYIVQLHHEDDQQNKREQVIYRMNSGQTKANILHEFFADAVTIGSLTKDTFMFKPTNPIPKKDEQELLDRIKNRFEELIKRPKPSI